MPPATNENLVRDAAKTSSVQVYCSQFDATLSELSRVCTEISELAVTRADVDWAAEIDIGLTEALTNVVRHGYGNVLAGQITLNCVETDSAWVLTLIDNGDPIPDVRLNSEDDSVLDFDPQDVQSLPEGGMGLSLMRRCFDRMDYQAGHAGNRLMLTKHLPSLTSATGATP